MSPNTIVRCAKDVFTTIILQNFHVFILLKISDQSVYKIEQYGIMQIITLYYTNTVL